MEWNDVKIMNADPSALGLLGLAIVTLVASSIKLGWTSGVSYAIPWVIFLGAFAQLFACINDSKRMNTFGTTAFGGYAFFWFAIGMTWMIKMGVFGEAMMNSADGNQVGVAFVSYFIFSVIMTIGAMETHKVLFSIFFLIDLLFLGLSLSTFGIMPEFTHGLAAWSELGISILAFYGTAASVLNPHFGYTFLPVGKPFGIFTKKNHLEKAA